MGYAPSPGCWIRGLGQPAASLPQGGKLLFEVIDECPDIGMQTALLYQLLYQRKACINNRERTCDGCAIIKPVAPLILTILRNVEKRHAASAGPEPRTQGNAARDMIAECPGKVAWLGAVTLPIYIVKNQIDSAVRSC